MAAREKVGGSVQAWPVVCIEVQKLGTCFLGMLWVGDARQSRGPDWLVHESQVYTH